MPTPDEKTSVRVESAGSGHPVDLEPNDTIGTWGRYRRLLNWLLRLALIGVAMWLIATPLRSGAAVLLV